MIRTTLPTQKYNCDVKDTSRSLIAFFLMHFPPFSFKDNNNNNKNTHTYPCMLSLGLLWLTAREK